MIRQASFCGVVEPALSKAEGTPTPGKMQKAIGSCDGTMLATGK